MTRPPVLLMLACLLAAGEPLPVTAGSSVVYDLTQRIGGERIAVVCLVRPGGDPHAYRPVPEDVRRLAGARLVIVNGLGFEGWFDGLAREARFAGTVAVATAGIPTVPLACRHGQGDGHGHGPDHDDDVPDPHPWNSIRQGVRYAENIRDALLAVDPAGAEVYRTRAAAVIDELRRTDAWAVERLAGIPRAQRRLVTDHDALAYFARDYGFTVVAIGAGLAGGAPDARRLAEVVALIRQQGVKGVFLQSGADPRLVQQVAAEAGVRLGAPLHLDGLGPADGPAATYVGMFRANIEAIAAALE